MIDTRKSAGMLLTEAAAAVTLSSEALTKVSGRILHRAVGNLVLHCVDQLDVANRTLHLADHAGHAFIALTAQPTGHFTEVPLPARLPNPN